MPKDPLKEARQLSEQIADSLPDRIEIASLSLNSKLPFKALSLRELFIHRMSELATAAVDLFEQQKIVPATVITRAAIETLAVLYVLHEQTNLFLNEKDISRYDDFLMECLMSSRNNPDLPKAKNILNSIDKVEKHIPKFRATYESLCEYTHPNWAGTFGSFGEINRENFALKLGVTNRTKALEIGISALCGTLLAFHHFYNELGDSVEKLNDYFERQGGKADT